jgi:hypothetical protein
MKPKNVGGGEVSLVLDAVEGLEMRKIFLAVSTTFCQD